MLQDKGNKRLDGVEEKISEAKDVGIETIQMERERKRAKKMNTASAIFATMSTYI